MWLLRNADTDLFMWLADDDELNNANHVSVLASRFQQDASCKMAFPDIDVFFDVNRKSGANGLLSRHFGSCLTDEDYLDAWCKFGGGHPFYGLFETRFLRSMDPGKYCHKTLVYFSEGIFLHRLFFFKGGIRFSPDVTLIYNGVSSSSKAPSRLMLFSFLRYSTSVHAMYVFCSLPLSEKTRLLNLIGKSHYPYLWTLAKKVLRNEMGG